MIRIDAIWLALGASDLRAGMDTLLSRVVREQTRWRAHPHRLRLCQPRCHSA